MFGLGVIFYREGDGLVDIEADGIADLLEGDGHLVLHRFDGEAEDLGDFLILQPVLFHELEDDLAFWRQLVDRFFDEREHIGGDEKLFGIEVDAGEFRMEFFEGVGRVALLNAEVV